MDARKIVINRDLLKVKDLVCRRENVYQGTEHETLSGQVEELHRKVNDLESRMRVKKSKSAAVFRRKKQIAYLVKQRGCVSSSDVAKALGISRNRANEYLKDMERSGLLATWKKGRSVLYSVGDKP